MFRKLKSPVLFALLALLLILSVVLLRVDSRKQKGNFVRELANADADKTTSIVIIPNGETDNAIILEKADGIWKVGTPGKMYPANPEHISRIFQTISPLVPEQLVSRGKDNLDEYEISGDKGTRIKIYQGKRLTDEFIYGKMDFQSQMIQGQQRPIISTFVRLAGKDDVYTVQGFLGSVFPLGAEHYRNQTVINTSESSIERINVSFENLNYTLSRDENKWMINEMPADSVITTDFIRKLVALRSIGFADEDAEGKLTLASHKMTIKQNSGEAIEILAFPADITHNYFITSSQNPGSVFSGAQNNLFENLFKPVEYFLGLQNDSQE
ncbi:MAG: DUF4340 domain-containing protein [Bacteroidales bacterium]